jgi:MFS family permease
MGTGASFAFVRVLTLAKEWFDEKTFTLVNGATLSVGTLGAMLGTTALNSVLESNGWNGVMFIITFCMCMLTIFIFFFSVEPDEIIKQRKLEKTSLKTMIKTSLLRALKNRHVWVNGMYLGFTYAFITTFVSLWCIPFFEALYGEVDRFTDFTPSFVYIGLTIGSITFSIIYNKYSRAVFILRLSTICLFVTSYLTLFINLPKEIMGILLFLDGFFIGSTALGFVVGNQWVENSYRGSSIAIMSLLMILPGAVILPIIGLIINMEHIYDKIKTVGVHSLEEYRVPFMIISATIFLAFILTFFIQEKKTFLKKAD